MTTASGDNCHAEFYMQCHLITVFNTLRLLQMGALIGPMFISASLWSSLVGVCSSWGSPIAITTAVYPL